MNIILGSRRSNGSLATSNIYCTSFPVVLGLAYSSLTLRVLLKMRFCVILVALLPFGQAANVILSNDDGWAEINIRQFYEALTSAGNSVVISAPAENESGSGKTYIYIPFLL